MELWIPITLAAAFCQNLRSALQRKLTDRLTADEASYVRFCYALPFALVYLVGLATLGGFAVPAPNAPFVAYAVLGSLAQILATVALIRSFSYHNFAVGTAYSKTETVQTALFGLVILGDQIGALAGLGILVSLIGVLLLSGQSSVSAMLKIGRAGWLGIGAGAAFAVSAVCYRAASLALPEGTFFVRAAVTLAVATATQTVVMGAYLGAVGDGGLARVARSWRVSVVVGLAGMLASAGWFSAMTLERAAYVRALGQIELVFAFLAAVLFFEERVRRQEVAGAALIVAGLLLLILR